MSFLLPLLRWLSIVPDPATTRWLPIWNTGATSGAGAGLIAGDLVWSVANTRVGSVLCDGTHYNSVADPSFAALYAILGTREGGTGPTDFAVPDIQGRTLVGKGTHADVNALGKNDGVATAYRTPVHNTSNSLTFSGAAGNTGTVSVDHSHYVSGSTGGRSAQHDHGSHIYQNAGGGPGGANMPGGNTGSSYFGDGASVYGEGQEHTHGVGIQTGGISANHTHGFTSAGSLSGSVGPGGTRPIDAPGYIVENCFIIK